MAAQGHHLIGFRPFPGTFLFRVGPPEKMAFRIGYAPGREKDPTVQKGLGWEEVARRRNFFILASALPPSELKYFPARDGAVNRFLFLLNRIILAYFLLLVVFFAGGAVYLLLLSSGSIALPSWELIARWQTRLRLGLVLFLAIHIVLTHLSHKLLHGDYSPWAGAPYPEQLTVKRKIGWVRRPDKLERWLEQKEIQGLQLQKVSRVGNSFFFAKRKPRKVRYCVDLKVMADRNYFTTHREAGWELFFTQWGSFAPWTIWGKTYEDEVPPPLYTDQTHLRNHALLVLVFQLFVLVPSIIMYGAYVRASIDHAVFRSLRVVYGLALVVLILLTLQAALYYQRIRKQAKLLTN